MGRTYEHDDAATFDFNINQVEVALRTIDLLSGDTYDYQKLEQPEATIVIEDSIPIDLLDGLKSPSLNKKARSTAITSLVKTYQDDPRVRQVLAERTSPKETANAESGSMSMYLHEMGKYSLLNAEQEIVLFQQIESGLVALTNSLESGVVSSDQEQAFIDLVCARQTVFTSNLRFVVDRTKKHFNNPNFLPLDLVQEGNLGLYDAINSFDINRGFRFSTHAAWSIRTRVNRFISDHGRSIRVPEHVYGSRTKLNASVEILEKQLGRKPDDHEVESYTGLRHEEVALIRESAIAVGSLDEPIRSSENLSLGTTIPDKTDHIEAATESMDQDDFLSGLIETTTDLTIKEKFVLSLRYCRLIESLKRESIKTKTGLLEYEAAISLVGQTQLTSFKEVGKLLGLSGQRIEQIERVAFIKIRRNPIMTGVSFSELSL
jgi:RNA polymerase sigma factor (sigma-70 family)